MLVSILEAWYTFPEGRIRYWKQKLKLIYEFDDRMDPTAHRDQSSKRSVSFRRNLMALSESSDALQTERKEFKLRRWHSGLR